jgi:hypothetical protein
MSGIEVAAFGLLGVLCIITVASFLTASQVARRKGNKNRYSSGDNFAGFSAGAYSHSMSVGDGCASDGGGGGDC